MQQKITILRITVLLVILTILYTVARIYQSRCCITPSYKQFFLLIANHWPLSIPSENIRKTSDVFRVHNKKILVWNVFLIFNRKHFFKKDFTTWKVSVFGVFLVRIFAHSDWIWIHTEYLSVFSPDAWKHGPEKNRIPTLFMRCLCGISVEFLCPH